MVSSRAYPIDDSLPPPSPVLRAFVAALLAAEAVCHRVERAVAARRHLSRQTKNILFFKTQNFRKQNKYEAKYKSCIEK